MLIHVNHELAAGLLEWPVLFGWVINNTIVSYYHQVRLPIYCYDNDIFDLEVARLPNCYYI